MEAIDEEKTDMVEAIAGFERHNKIAVQRYAELLDKNDKLEQDVAMLKASKVESDKIRTELMAILEEERESKHKVIDDTLTAVVNNDGAVIMKLQVDMEEKDKHIQKRIDMLHQRALNEMQTQEQWEAMGASASGATWSEKVDGAFNAVRGEECENKSAEMLRLECAVYAEFAAFAEAWIGSAWIGVGFWGWGCDGVGVVLVGGYIETERLN